MPRLTSSTRDDVVSASFRKWLIPIVSVGAILVGGIAAAEMDTTEDPVVDTSVTTTTDVTEPSGDPIADPSDEPADDDEESDAAVERYWGPECGDGEPTNHGQYVRSQDKGGASRSEAAQSPCGKPLSSVEVTTPTIPEAPDTDDPAGDDTAITPSPSSPGNGNGNSGNGNGNSGNGNGNGNSGTHGPPAHAGPKK